MKAKPKSKVKTKAKAKAKSKAKKVTKKATKRKSVKHILVVKPEKVKLRHHFTNNAASGAGLGFGFSAGDAFGDWLFE